MKKLIALLCIGTLQLAAQTTQKLEEPPKVVAANDDDTPRNVSGIDVKPEFPGGIQQFYMFVAKNYRTPEHPEMQSGKVIASFVIERDGSVTNVKILRDMGFGTGEEAVRVLNKSPKWSPGEQNGRKVRTMFTIPIQVMAPEPDPIYPEAEVNLKPEFATGESGLNSFFEKNFKGKGTFTVNFIVEPDGMLTFIKCDPTTSPDSCTEIKRVLTSAPRWRAGKKDNWFVRTQMTRTFTVN
ncbi:energy transducer TonB [Flavobacterium sp. MAH-1]|uniref:Energy transducer TonB n=1 Tax=Flavobacterium agri TaxID=2743471 RepID=A0A7Y9C765_9FLAO|nr:energy transducer TonB [Flavobacterium agri]NUY81018.1 energy transducer TonB [Flavobacterium agri]NYA71042.1 energy transducer TonB [Flavobacterium agri]